MRDIFSTKACFISERYETMIESDSYGGPGARVVLRNLSCSCLSWRCEPHSGGF